MADFQLNYTGNEINTNLGLAATAIQPTNLASTTAVGVVKVDGTSITAATDGTISGTKNVQLYYDGTSIYDKEGGTVQTYTSIYALMADEKNIVTVNHSNSILLYPVYHTGDAVCFSDAYIINNKAWVSRLIINSDNAILFDEYDVTNTIATTSAAGIVKPDGTTITIDSNGVISGAAQGANQDLSNLSATGEAHFVKATDYASSSKGGVIKTASSYGVYINASGQIYSSTYNYNNYTTADNGLFVGKGTLENVLTAETVRVDSAQSLTDTQKTQARSNIDAVTTADITSAVSTHNSSTTAHSTLFDAKANVRTLVADTTSTTATLTLAENTDYTFSQPLTSLTISNGITTMNEATVTFTAGSTITVSIPTTVKNLGAEVEFEANGTYTMSFWNGFVIVGVQS